MDDRIAVVLDTDIGPDCDDAGALLMLLQMERAGLCKIAAVTHCTSNIYGSACIDAICRYEGRPDIEIGTLMRKGVLDGPECMIYNREIANKYDNRFKSKSAPDAIKVLRRTVASHDKLLLISIGPFGNLADFLQSSPDEISPLSGVELAAAKIPLLVSMAARFEGGNREFNFFVEPKASATTLELWPNNIVFSPWEVGEDVITGRDMPQVLGEEHPVTLAYKLYSPQGRASYDQTAVMHALLPNSGLFTESAACTVSVDPITGDNSMVKSPDGKHKYIKKAVSADETAAFISTWMYGSGSFSL